MESEYPRFHLLATKQLTRRAAITSKWAFQNECHKIQIDQDFFCELIFVRCLFPRSFSRLASAKWSIAKFDC